MLENFKQRITNKSFISFIGSYLIGGWAMIQFVDWIIIRYNYAPILTDLLLFFLLLLIPGVLLVAWRQTGGITTSKKGIGFLSINIVLALLLSSFGFKDQLFANPEKIKVVNEEGEEVVRAIPNQSVAKRIVLFPFSSKAKGFEHWKALGWSKLQALDIEQDNRIFTTNALDLHFKDYVQDHKYELFDDIPFSVQRKIAQDNLADFWISCSINDSLTYKVYSTQDGEVFYTKSYAKTNVYSEIDAFTKELNSALFNKEIFGNRKKKLDLPASELLSSNTEALQHFFNGRIASLLENDHPKAVSLMQEATKADPNFYLAHAEYGAESYYTGNPTEAVPAFEKALGLIDHLPERQQFSIKIGYYRFSQDMIKLIRLLEMWRKLYPNDYRPYSQLFSYYQGIGQLDKAVAIGNQALEAGHKGPMLLRLARLNISLEKFDEATRYLNTYKEAYPDKAASVQEIGDIYLKQGKLQEAIDFFEELTVLDPSNHSAFLSLADAFKEAGNFKKAEKTINSALRKANTLQDTIASHKVLETILDRQGKIKAAIELMEKRWDLIRKIYPEVAVSQELMHPQTINRYHSIGRQEEAKAALINAAGKIQNDQVDIVCALLINYYMAIEDGAGIKEQMDRCGEDVKTTSGDLLYTFVEGLQEKGLGNYKAAIPKIKMFIDSSGLGNSSMGLLSLADTYRLDGQVEKAQSMFEKVLETQPNNPALLYEYALCLKDANQIAAAKKSLAKSLDIWKEADANFSGLVDAQTLALALE